MTTKDRRAKLSVILHDILGSDEVHFEPPESIKMKYPAIVYSRAKIQTHKADNIKYHVFDRYEVTYIHKTSEDEVLERLLDLEYASHDRIYKTNDLYHDVFTINIQ